MIFKPSEYAQEFYDGCITSATIRNWCKSRKLPNGHRAEVTPTGQYLIHVDEAPKTKAEELLSMLEA